MWLYVFLLYVLYQICNNYIASVFLGLVQSYTATPIKSVKRSTSSAVIHTRTRTSVTMASLVGLDFPAESSDWDHQHGSLQWVLNSVFCDRSCKFVTCIGTGFNVVTYGVTAFEHWQSLWKDTDYFLSLIKLMFFVSWLYHGHVWIDWMLCTYVVSDFVNMMCLILHTYTVDTCKYW